MFHSRLRGRASALWLFQHAVCIHSINGKTSNHKIISKLLIHWASLLCLFLPFCGGKFSMAVRQFRACVCMHATRCTTQLYHYNDSLILVRLNFCYYTNCLHIWSWKTLVILLRPMFMASRTNDQHGNVNICSCTAKLHRNYDSANIKVYIILLA